MEDGVRKKSTLEGKGMVMDDLVKMVKELSNVCLGVNKGFDLNRIECGCIEVEFKKGPTVNNVVNSFSNVVIVEGNLKTCNLVKENERMSECDMGYVKSHFVMNGFGFVDVVVIGCFVYAAARDSSNVKFNRDVKPSIDVIIRLDEERRGWDCGLFMVKYMEILVEMALGIRMHLHMIKERKKMAVELFIDVRNEQRAICVNGNAVLQKIFD
ncbi:hypothetical protein ACH5RR_038950 [Cinchona calisaya]|uniref:Ubiquitin-like protease family profile domain-containing protein n=1 Tax=Cinchona calisaya TaxID=153742 RepID=A0ABD2XWT6_9GENT